MQDVLAWLQQSRGNYVTGLQLLMLHFPDALELGVLAKMDTVANRKVIRNYLSKLVQQEKTIQVVKVGAPSVVIVKSQEKSRPVVAAGKESAVRTKTTNQREWGQDGRKLLDKKSRVVNQRHILSNQNSKNDSLSQEERAALYEQAKALFAEQVLISKELDSYQNTGFWYERKKKSDDLTAMSDEALVHLYRSANSQISRSKKIQNKALLEKWQRKRTNICAELQRRGVKTS